MASLTCRECGETFDDILLSCPNCGAAKFQSVASVLQQASLQSSTGVSLPTVAGALTTERTAGIGSVARSVERLLAQAEEAVIELDWVSVRSYASGVLSFDPHNQDGISLLAVADKNLAGGQSSALLLSPARILVFSAISAGLYILFWFYLTWKQLRVKTRENHYPIWHALTLTVPVYGLFRMHNHLEVIEELAVPSSAKAMNPRVGVFLLVAANVMGWISGVTFDVSVALPLAIIATVLIMVLLWRAQIALNAIWLADNPNSKSAPVSWVEVVLAITGVLVWIGTIFPE